ncbi:MAG: hypothetical protein AAFO61_04535 [Pseudomonadota bacterium]
MSRSNHRDGAARLSAAGSMVGEAASVLDIMVTGVGEFPNWHASPLRPEVLNPADDHEATSALLVAG